MSMRFSIALATCNGARFLPELLESLATQQLPPFEIVACDDASDDGTVAILESFAVRALFPVRIHRNPTRLGVVENFSRAIAACNGNYIALADQDDVWHTNKLARLSEALAVSAVVAAFSDANVVAENLDGLGYTIWKRVCFKKSEQQRTTQGYAFEVLLKHQVVTGATLAFKATLRQGALPIPSGWPHDAWLALIAAAEGRLVAVNEALIDYRQHENNVVGGRRQTHWREAWTALSLDRSIWYRDEIRCWRALAERLATLHVSPSAKLTLTEKITHLETRASLPNARWRRLPSVWREITAGRYTRHARNWGSIAIDLLVK